MKLFVSVITAIIAVNIAWAAFDLPPVQDAAEQAGLPPAHLVK